jgi:hypothetical protein
MKELLVKFVARGKWRDPAHLWLRQFPRNEPKWGECRFLFDPEATRYDWLVVYDDLPSREGERFSRRVEKLACPQENTLLVTGEPASIKLYGQPFLKQFGHILTSQEPWVIRHPGAIYSQPGLRWFFGLGREKVRTFDEMAATGPEGKTKQISTVCSSKRQRHTLHRRRYDFVQDLKSRLSELEIYGHGVRFIDDKAEAVDPYRYHVSIENHVAPHHWTEKLADAFLGWSLPFYCGCPNVEDYFPAESVIRISIDDPDTAASAIRSALAADEWTRRLPAIAEARRRVLHDYNLFALLSRLIAERAAGASLAGPGRGTPGRIFSRHQLRRTRPWTLVQDGLERLRYARLSARR